MRALQILAGTTLLIAQISSGQITQLEQKETRTFHGTHSLSSGLKDLYKYAGKTNTVILDEGKKLTILDCYSRVGHPSWVSIDVKYGSSSERFNIYYGTNYTRFEQAFLYIHIPSGSGRNSKHNKSPLRNFI
jgi:hypothetical protein